MSHKALLALPLLLGPLLAGCISWPVTITTTVDVDGVMTGLSAIQFDLLPGESVFVPASSDATNLHLRLFRPDAPENWSAPTILVMSPYFGPDSRAGYNPADPRTWDAAARPGYWRYAWLIDHFGPRGYAVALADVRGTGESGGCLEQTAQLQTQDGHDIVQWLATQPWSNGKVGMYGKSYDAETQISTATAAPPGLATIIPVSSVSGQYEYSYYDGVPYTAQTLLSNAFYAVGDGLQPGSTVESHTAAPSRVGCNGEHMIQALDESGTWNAYWESREFRRNADKIEAAVLYVHGLQDWNVKPVAIRDMYADITAPKMALLGQWAHDYPEDNRYRNEWSRQDWQELVWRWYDHWLLERSTGIEALLGNVQVQDNAGQWRAQADFPAKDATPRAFHLTGDRLATEPAPSPSPRSYLELGAPHALALATRGLQADLLTYLSDPLAEPIRWSGWPTVTLNVSLDRDDAHFAVHLLTVDPSGKEQWVNRAYLSAQHRSGLDKPAPVPTGQVVTYELRFFPSDTIVPEGHRLALRIMPSDGWTSGAGNMHTATIHDGTLVIPSVTVPAAAFLDAPMGDPIRKPVTWT